MNREHKKKTHYSCKICHSTLGLKSCSKCRRTFYCSKNCQKIDWRTHKSECDSDQDVVIQSNGVNVINGSNGNSSVSGVYTYQESYVQPTNTHTYDEAREQQFHQLHNTLEDELNQQQQHNFYLFNNEESSVRKETLNEQAEAITPYITDNNNSDLKFGYIDQPQSQSSTEQQTFEDELFEQMQSDLEPANQQFLKETKDNLEKQLLMFNETYLKQYQSEGEQSISGDQDKMGVSGENFLNGSKFDESFLYSEIAEQYNLEEMCCNLIRDMNEYGVSVIDNFLGNEKGNQVLGEVIDMYSAGMFKDGQLVDSRNRNDLKRIRGDKITWISGTENGVSNIAYLINQVDTLITLANRMLKPEMNKLGTYSIRERTKAMVACYEGNGSQYVKHVDNPNADGRCITAIYYLNVDWDVRQSGGLLRIFPEGRTDKVADIEPIFDRILFFWSDRRNPHEVQPAHKTRYAITLWYFDSNERSTAVSKYQRERANRLKAASVV